ncbi:MAG: acetylglutamate kinase [Dehalococcoidales bacterium]|nr:acetylglutamate kinase [Dehalococcoidales bacterium]
MESTLKKAIVVKLGGSVYSSRDSVITDIIRLQSEGHPVVIIHGGASLITKWLKKQNCTTSFYEGERITDSASLDVVTAVLAGLVNKEIVSTITDAGGKAIGISGADGGLIQGKIKDRAKGYIGSVVKIDTSPLEAILAGEFIPVIAPVSRHSFEREAAERALLNINGDTAAGAIAAKLYARRLVFLTDVSGIKDENGAILGRISASHAKELIESRVAYGGMIPKIRACLDAASNRITACSIINGSTLHSLYKEITEGDTGTSIYPD